MSRLAPLAETADTRLSEGDKGLPARAAGLTVREFLDTAPRLGEFWTPLLALDREALEHNAETIQHWCDERGLELMPHGKTTMAPALWRLQLGGGATGLTLATPGQVRTARGFGVRTIMLANALVAPDALAWIAGEHADPEFEFWSWADSIETIEAMERGLATATASGGPGLPRPIAVLVELGAGGGRTGARGIDEAVGIARRIADSPVLRLAGVAGYEGSLGHDRSSVAVAAVRDYLADLVELHGAVRTLADPADGPLVVTAGGSAYLDLVADVFAPEIESGAGRGDTRWVLRSGASLVHDDGFYRGISPIHRQLTPAMRGYTRVVSHPEPGLALLDGGKRDLPYDEGLPVPLAVASELGADGRPLAEASVTAVNDQHAYLRADAPGAALPVAVGEVVALGLSHPCTAFDKWRWIPVVEHAGSDLVVDLVHTRF
ncbi:alanine racemase [Agromyces italicus]|uniref:alanine racemase n=1 Tax=Agromyces italicus TaxID=279572 RepID=UPI0003B4A62F|nr:alanine racemase [Agromyces italicus]